LFNFNVILDVDVKTNISNIESQISVLHECYLFYLDIS